MAALKRGSQPSIDAFFFATPQQKVMRLLLSEPTTIFTVRLLSSKLKGVRGLGGSEGLTRTLGELEDLGVLDFVDNRRGVRLRDESPGVTLLKKFSAICDLESLQRLLEPTCSRGILFGSRASGRARSDSDYDLFVVSESPEEAVEIASGHPLGKSVELLAWTPERYDQISTEDPELGRKLEKGIVLWGAGS